MMHKLFMQQKPLFLLQKPGIIEVKEGFKLQILRRLRRGQKDPNPYPVRSKRRRKRPRPLVAGNEWYTWGRVHDKQDGRTADYLPSEYVDSLEREDAARRRWSLRRKAKGICNAVRLFWEVLPFFVDEEGVFYPYARFVGFTAAQSRADCFAGLKALSLLAARIRAYSDPLRDYLGMDDECFDWWMRGLNAARTSLMSRLISETG